MESYNPSKDLPCILIIHFCKETSTNRHFKLVPYITVIRGILDYFLLFNLKVLFC